MKYARDLIPAVDTVPSRMKHSHPEIKDETFWSMYEKSKDFSMVHITGFYNVYQSLKYIGKNKIKGSIVECGCFLGGVAAFMGLARRHFAIATDIILFDTFEGPPVGSHDNDHTVSHALPDYEQQVRENISEVVGSFEGYRTVRGLVEDTLPDFQDEALSLIRLDTDFYSSTKVELEVLYPRLSDGGVVIIDDYGLFQGSRKATDDYLETLDRPPLLNRIDGGVWSGVKPQTTGRVSTTERESFWSRVVKR